MGSGRTYAYFAGRELTLSISLLLVLSSVTSSARGGAVDSLGDDGVNESD